VTTQVFRALMESVAGEHGARMTAMESASKNAKEMIDVLTIQYNKARQERITKELLDIVGGAEALRRGVAADTVARARDFLSLVPLVALTRGWRGLTLLTRQGVHEVPSLPRPEQDPTGAGDAFAGGFLAAIVAGRTLEAALDQAIVSASFALEDWGARGLLAATREEADRRLREWLGSGAER